MLSDNYKDLELTHECLIGQAAILKQIRPIYEYGSDGKSTGKVVGTKLIVISRKLGYSRLGVRLPLGVVTLTQKELDEFGEELWIRFRNFRAKLYRINGDYDYFCEASDYESVDNEPRKAGA